jgi:hypothetical protein
MGSSRKLYNIAASLIAQELAAGHPELASIDRPHLVDVRLSLRQPGAAPSASQVERVVAHHLASLSTLVDDQLSGALAIAAGHSGRLRCA